MDFLPPVVSELRGSIGDFKAKMGDAKKTMGEVGDESEKQSSRVREKMGAGMIAAGAAVGGLGAKLHEMAAEGEQSQARLTQAVAATGKGYDEYAGRIDQTIARMNKFGADNNETQGALTTLTRATGDTGKALDQMGIVADLAAAKNISLEAAAKLVAKVDVGKGAKTLAEFGLASADAAKEAKKLGDASAKANKDVESSADGLGDAQRRLADLKERQAGKDKLSIG